MKTGLPRLLTLLGLLQLAACAQSPGAAPTQPAAPAVQDQAAADPKLTAQARPWRLVELMGQPVKPDEQGRVPTLIFSADGASVSGFAGCNSFSGQATLGQGPQRLRLGPLAATLRACPDMALEQQYLRMLDQVDGYFADGRQLHLHRARMAPLARFEQSAP